MKTLPLGISLTTLLLTGCGQSPAPGAPRRGTPDAAAATAPVVPVGAPEATSLATRVRHDDPVIGGSCPAGTGATEMVAAGAERRIPLAVGLTLATAWHRTTEADDVECLTQIQSITASAVSVSASCAMPDGTVGGTRTICHDDLDTSAIYYSGAGDDPDTLKGTTMFSLSRAAFRELKERRETAHRNVSINEGAIISDLRGALTLAGTGTLAAVVNDRLEQLPVLRAEGRLRGVAMGKPVDTRVLMAVLDDAQFPLVLDYQMPDIGKTGFFVRYTRITFPSEHRIEDRLTTEKRVDVYGIYFDFASDRLRPESEPVLREIAGALGRHADWQLSIDGHTDNVGGDRANLMLSERRSAAVRNVLISQYGIDSARLVARGLGATQPKATNETREGRAQNRRVELVRQ
jgi:outer membrane protein OmpA-like peptidoglycan-associated protein